MRDLLGNWERFVNAESDIDPLMRMAVQHYQFEAIHPFRDGNGRTGPHSQHPVPGAGRAARQADALPQPPHPAHQGDYYRLLQRVTPRGEWEPWMLYMLTAVEETARWTNQQGARHPRPDGAHGRACPRRQPRHLFA